MNCDVSGKLNSNGEKNMRKWNGGNIVVNKQLICIRIYIYIYMTMSLYHKNSRVCLLLFSHTTTNNNRKTQRRGEKLKNKYTSIMNMEINERASIIALTEQTTITTIILIL